MSSNNGPNFDPGVAWARLGERVDNQAKDIIDLRSNMNTGFQSVNASLNALSNELRNNSRTPWPVIWSAIGVSFAILGFLGSQTVSPIKESVTDLRAIVSRSVGRDEMDWRTARAAEDRQRVESILSGIRNDLVPRVEIDQRIADVKERVDRLERQKAAP